MAGVGDDIENLRVNREDFLNALNEVTPAFGVAKEESAPQVLDRQQVSCYLEGLGEYFTLVCD